jgi:transposase
MKYTMSAKELARLAVIKGAIEGACTVKQAARKLGVSTRRVKHLKKTVREQGGGAVIHGNSGRHPLNATDEAVRKKIIALKKSGPCNKANFTRFREPLEEHERITVSYTCLSGILKDAGIQSPKTRRSGSERRTARERWAKCGELVQTDASPSGWLGSGVHCALHGFQDDAAGDILALYLCEHECLRHICLQGYFEAFRAVLQGYGVPEALYAGRTGACFVNTKKPENWPVEEQPAGKTLDKTQFGHIAETLGCELIPAGSPRAKGRIERLWETLRSRLPVRFALNGITTLVKANAALPRFIREFNRRFRREPACRDETAFAPLPAAFSLDTLLAAKYTRKTDNCGCFSFPNHTFQVDSPRPPVKKTIVFLFSEKIGFKVYYDKKYYGVKFPEFLNKDKKSHMPQVTKRLIHDSFFAGAKNPELARGG